MSDAQYSEEERAAAWAAYYASQGYDASQIASMAGGYAQPEASSSSYAATDDTFVPSATGTGYAMPGYDANGYKIQMPSGPSTASASTSTAAKKVQPVQVLDAEPMKKLVNPAYAPGAADKAMQAMLGKPKKKEESQEGQQPKFGAARRDTVVRQAGGRKWEDATLMDWDPKWYRLFVGDVSNDVSERTLDEAFNKYRSYCKCKVVRDRLSQKAKYGFIAFKEPEDYLQAWKEMDGKYVGNRPIRLSKIKEDKYGSTAKVTLSARKAKEMDKLARNKGKPPTARPVPW